MVEPSVWVCCAWSPWTVVPMTSERTGVPAWSVYSLPVSLPAVSVVTVSV
ncbi:hypothetical protein SMICM304S_05905 [Streptomyces microflavus]